MNYKRSFWIIIFILFSLEVTSQTLEEGKAYLDSLLLISSIKEDFEIDSIELFPNGFQKVWANVYYECDGDICPYFAKGLITPNADTIAPILWDVILLDNGNVLIDGKKAVVLDTQRNVKKCYKSVRPFAQDLAVVQSQSGYGLINRNGEEVLPLVYDYIETPDERARVAVRKNGEWEILEEEYFFPKAKQQDQDLEFTSLYGYISSPFIVKITDPETYLIGFINLQGTVVQPYQYDDIEYFFSGNIIASKNNWWGLMDENGKELSPFKYKKIHDTGYAVVIVSNDRRFAPRYGLLAPDGTEAAPMQYVNISTEPVSIKDDLYWIVKKLDQKWGLLSYEGKEITPMIYDEIKGDKGLLDGEWVLLLK